MNIKTWQERAGVKPEVVGTVGYEGAMQQEIDELRTALASVVSLQIATYTQVVVLDGKVAAQRKVLEQALDFIKTTNKSSQFLLVPASNLNKVITAIQEQLK